MVNLPDVSSVVSSMHVLDESANFVVTIFSVDLLLKTDISIHKYLLLYE